MVKAPYGTWESPITAEAITKGANTLSDVLVDPLTSEIYHLENRPSEAGRCVLVHTSTGRDVVGKDWNVRTMVQEYGGAQAIVHGGIAYFSHVKDGRVYKVGVAEGSGDPEAVTPEGVPYRYAAFEPIPTHPHLLISILEDHTIDVPADVVTTLVVLDTKAKTVSPLVSGADFYASPKISPNGKRIAWVQWFHPDMPWEGGQVQVADLVVSDDGKVSLENTVHVAGKKETQSACYPAWANDDRLVFTLDVSGFANPWKYENGKASPVFGTPVNEDFASPFWILNFSFFGFVDEDTSLYAAIKDGRSVLYAVDLKSGAQPILLESPFAVIEDVRTVPGAGKVVFLAQKTTEGEGLFEVQLSRSADLKTIDIKELKAPSASKFDANIVSQPQPISLKVGPEGSPLHVVYYPPHNPAYEGSSVEGEKPPCIVSVHGGPTAMTPQGLTWSKQYLTSRGFAWLDVNYGGSSGYGRKYIERLAGSWGIVDVEDCITAPQALAADPYNLVDRKRLFIRGGSAGGYTVLAALSIASDVTVFAGATSLYGVSDLVKLGEFTHKFESQYTTHLVGKSLEEDLALHQKRSPINSADKIVVPLLILQGEIDMVVPKGQAEAIYNSIKERGGVVEYKLYPGEGHGWRQEPNMRDALERELGFYERILGLKN